MRCIADVMEIDTGADVRAMTMAQVTTWGGQNRDEQTNVC